MMSEPRPLPDLFEEAKRLVDGARAQGVTLRLLGGLAARFHCQALLFCLREYSDIDLMGLSRQRAGIERVFADLGYEPHRMFNALHGDRRLEFRDPGSDRHVDVFLDRFEMDHTLDLRRRLEIEPYTISLGDLLLTKLQVQRLNAKDVRDILTLLKDLPLGEQDMAGALDFGYMAATCAKDWGLYHTVMTNVSHMGRYIDDYPLNDEEKKAVLARIARLQREMEAAPKNWRWKLRSLVGERMPWYQVVEGQG